VRVTNSHWRPDLAFLNDEIVSVYEIKPELISYSELRQGLMQCLEGLINGYKSYLVIDDSYIPELNKFLPFLPKLGIIMYSANKQLSLISESSIPEQAKEVSKLATIYTKEESEIVIPIHQHKRKGHKRGTAVKVRACVYTRQSGVTISSPAYTRKRPNRKSHKNNLLGNKI